ncbi:MAG TPA: hypothetical protein VLR91_08540 [Thermodesulfobacteriota bacterium]|nr:hypothetical protein [Thermodesulfobacteriota bacterium]
MPSAYHPLMECQYCKILFVVEAELPERKTARVYLQELERAGILRGEKRGREMVCRYPSPVSDFPLLQLFL